MLVEDIKVAMERYRIFPGVYCHKLYDFSTFYNALQSTFIEGVINRFVKLSLTEERNEI